MSVFNVELKKIVDDSYEVEIGINLMDKLIEDIKNGLVGGINKFAIITDDIVEPLYATRIYDKVKACGYKSDLFVFPAGEKSKVRAVKEQLEDAMLAREYRRDCCVIAVGGGVVSDLAGFVAGTFGRGVPFINYATTHLAAADASIGGKTAVDTDLATNLIGLIYQPKKVYVDVKTWETLPMAHRINGMAETIKHACLADYELFEYLENNFQKVLDCDEEACIYISEHNCNVKYQVVMKDEKEKSLREILNLGHTVGRAVETVSDYRLLHGEAVSIGLVAQAMLGCKLGFLTQEECDRTIALLKSVGLPVAIPDYIDREELVKKLYTDKKVRDGKLRFVFQKGIGDVMQFGDDVYARPTAEDEIREIIEKL
ncbi:3-dehydroquinate synthase [Eubacterium xylanophilum]|uniref:3-dehydroquinate synthase n=1 Tax=Eubacterium xylanophilum TaxID=39497 RepID=UPI00047B2634|nr:3-dehydroquinate synthase [Eubacterium xylanophilum]